MRSLQESHDRTVEDLIARQAHADTLWQAQKQDLSKRVQSLAAAKQEVEGRALGLAKSLGLRTVELEVANAAALKAEAGRLAAERARDGLTAQVARLEGQLAAALKNTLPTASSSSIGGPGHSPPHPNRFVESVTEMTDGIKQSLAAGASSFSPPPPFALPLDITPPEEGMPAKSPMWALRPLYQTFNHKRVPPEP